MGVLYMLGSAFFFGLMSVLVKSAGQGLPSQEIVVARSAIGLLLSYLLLRHARLRPWGQGHWRLLILRGVFGFGALTCFFYALTRLPIAEATIIQFTSPIWTALLAALLLGERIGRLLTLSIGASLAGVVLITRPPMLFGGGTSSLDLFAVGVALTGALLSAAAYITVRKLSRSEAPLVIVFYFALVATPVSIVTAAPILVLPSAREWLLLIGVGIVTQIAQICLTRGLKLEPAGRAMSIGYAQIVFAALLGVIFFAEIPDAAAIAGGLLVAAGVIAVAATRAPAP